MQASDQSEMAPEIGSMECQHQSFCNRLHLPLPLSVTMAHTKYRVCNGGSRGFEGGEEELT